MKLKLLLSWVLLFSFFPGLLFPEHSISEENLTKLANLYAEQRQLIDIIERYLKEKTELSKSLQDTETERENELKERENRRKEREVELEKIEKRIEEKEKELEIIEKSIEDSEKEKEILIQSSKLSEEQLQEEKKSSMKSWITKVLLFLGGLAIGYAIGAF